MGLYPVALFAKLKMENMIIKAYGKEQSRENTYFWGETFSKKDDSDIENFLRNLLVTI
jgi:hypothetical protein